VLQGVEVGDEDDDVDDIADVVRCFAV